MIELDWQMHIINRYILRETVPMVFLSLLVFTFVLMIPPIMQVAQTLIAKGVDGWTIATLMLTLVPQGLGVTIPMAVLIGLLMGLGRMSGDREMVAMQACGVSIYRLLRPVIALAVMTTLMTCYILTETLPDANQAFRDITFRTLAARADDEVKARIFDQGFPGLVLYVGEVDIQGTGWSNVFLADTRQEGPAQVYIADEGRILLDPEARKVEIVLAEGSLHRIEPDDPNTYNVSQFSEIVISLAPDAVFPEGGPQRGLTEMRIHELQAQIIEMEAAGMSAHNPIMEIHQKFSIPVACLVFGLIGLALGVTNRKDGRLASFALGIGVIFAYYIIMFGAKAMAKGALVSPHFAMWIPNIVLGLTGILLLLLRARSSGRQLLPSLSGTTPPQNVSTGDAANSAAPAQRQSASAPRKQTARQVGIRANAGWSRISVISLLDQYVVKQYFNIVALAFVGLLGIFYISTFIDLSDKLFKGETTLATIGEYFWYATPQFVYYVLPISALISTLITIGVLTKSSELTVMKACGISLYRASFPLLLFSLVWSGVLFSMSESFLADANRRANELRRVIRGGAPQFHDVLNRQWIVSPDGSIYNYSHFDPAETVLHDLNTYRFAQDDWQLVRRAYARYATYDERWEGREIWMRDFNADLSPGAFNAASALELPLESPAYFATERPDAERMNYRELNSYIAELSASGVDVVALRVALQGKLSFPFVTLVLTLIAVPFAVTTGRHGALYGIGIGIVLALSYWVVISIFSAIGSAGLLTPLLAAWAPNVIFGGSALYLLLAVRT